MSQKRCSRCHVHKDITTDNYHKDATSKDGFSRRCKPCTKEYFQERRDIMIANTKRWQEENRERYNAYQREWHRNKRFRMKFEGAA